MNLQLPTIKKKCWVSVKVVLFH